MGGGTPLPYMQYNTSSTSTRSFSVSGSGEFVFSIADPSDFYLNTFSQSMAGYSQLALQGPGTHVAGVFTPNVGALDVNLLSNSTASLSPGTYRVVMAFGRTFEASSSFNIGNEAAWGVYTVPSPGAIIALGMAGAVACRRRRS